MFSNFKLKEPKKLIGYLNYWSYSVTDRNALVTDRIIKHERLKTKKKRAKKFSVLMVSYIGSFIGISSVALLNGKIFSSLDNLLLIGSFGATAVIIYGLKESPLAHPRRVLLGHMLSAIIGVACFTLFGNTLWLSAALAVSTSISIMQVTDNIHPPGGATALIAVIGSAKIHNLGYYYAIMPVGTGISIMLLIAFLTNYLHPKKRKFKNL